MLQDYHRLIIENREKKSGVSPIGMLVRKEINYEVIEAYYQEKTSLSGMQLSLFMFEEIKKHIATDKGRLQQLKSMRHKDYLLSGEWRAKRKAIIYFYNRCQLCGETYDVYHVHHNKYENKPLENFEDLLVLCEYCHEQHHRDKKDLERFAKSVISWTKATQHRVHRTAARLP